MVRAGADRGHFQPRDLVAVFSAVCARDLIIPLAAALVEGETDAIKLQRVLESCVGLVRPKCSPTAHAVGFGWPSVVLFMFKHCFH
jgi:hypothetical protein